jgi:acyl carrier protein
MQLVAYVQQAFGVELTDDDIDLAHFSSIDNMVGLLIRKQAASS